MDKGGEIKQEKIKAKKGIAAQTRLIITGLVVSTVFIFLAACFATPYLLA